MAGNRDLTYRVGVDASDAVSGLKKLDSTVKQTMRNVEGELDDGATAGDKFAASIDQLAADLKSGFDKSATAAKELQQALRNVDSDLNVGDAVAELSRMGFTFDEITADADKFAASLKQLDDVRMDGVKQLDAVAPGLATKLDDVGKSADSSKSVLANMVGNATQDLGALGGVAGSAGVAIGQMGEYMADAAASGEGFGSIVKNFAGVAGPILGLTVALGAVQKVMGSIAESKAFDKEQAEAFSAAIDDVGEGARAVLQTIKDAQAVTGRAGGLFGTRALDSAKDITDTLIKAKVGVDEWALAVAEGGAPLDTVTGKLGDLQHAAEEAFKQSPTEENAKKIDEAVAAIEILKETHKTYSDQLADDTAFAEWQANSEAGKAATEAWNTVLANGLDGLKASSDGLDDMADSADGAARKARLLADKVAEFNSQYDQMTARLDNSTSLINIAQAFDDVRVKAGESATAIHEGSDDAQAKLYEQAVAQNNLKQMVVDYKDELGRLPPEVITRINALVDQGELQKAEDQLTILTRNRDANIRIILKGGAGYGPIAGPGAGPRAVLPAPAAMLGAPAATTTVVAPAATVGPVAPIDVPVRLVVPPHASADLAKRIGPLNIAVALAAHQRLSGIRD